MSEMEILKQYAALEKERRRLKSALDKVVAQQEEMEEDVLDALSEVDNVKIDGLVFRLNETMWPAFKVDGTPKERHERLCKALEALGLDDYVAGIRANMQGLAAFLRKKVDENGHLPKDLAEIAEILEMKPKYKVSTRKG